MNFYNIKFGLNSAAQSKIIDLLKNVGADVIQTSGGLCVRSTQPIEEVKKIIGNDQVSVELINRESALSDDSLSEDIKHFLKS